jgi:NAD dependent epimerase/dehydratase family
MARRSGRHPLAEQHPVSAAIWAVTRCWCWRNRLSRSSSFPDLTDYRQALEALRGADAVVHLANIPAPEIGTPAVTFNANVAMNFNVFMAAARLGLSRVVWASSETTLGLPFEAPPRYAPVDEDTWRNHIPAEPQQTHEHPGPEPRPRPGSPTAAPEAIRPGIARHPASSRYIRPRNCRHVP